MDVLASAAAVIIEPEVRSQERRTEIGDRLAPLMADGGPVVALQPIVDLATGDRVGAEALSRFPADWGMAPGRRLRRGAQHRPRPPARAARARARRRAPGPRRRLRRDERLPRHPADARSAANCSRRLPLPAGPARAVRARPGRGLRHAERRAAAVPGRGHAAGHRRRRRGLLLAAAHRRHLPRRHQDRPEHRHRAQHRPGADQAGPVAGRVRARLPRPRGRRGRGDRRRGRGAAHARRRLRPGLALRPPRPAGGTGRRPVPAASPRPARRRTEFAVS